jgi:hypothetical protein
MSSEPVKARTITWRCEKGHETDLVVGPTEIVPPARMDSIRASFSNGCHHKVKGGTFCGARVREFGS